MNQGINKGDSANSFFGQNAGLNTSGSVFPTTEGGANSFFGAATAGTNTTGSFNTIVGWAADVGANNLTNATAIGASAGEAKRYHAVAE